MLPAFSFFSTIPMICISEREKSAASDAEKKAEKNKRKIKNRKERIKVIDIRVKSSREDFYLMES